MWAAPVMQMRSRLGAAGARSTHSTTRRASPSPRAGSAPPGLRGKSTPHGGVSGSALSGRAEPGTLGSLLAVPIRAAADRRSGLPADLASGIESLAGVDLSGVRVHRNSSRPAELGALAYARGQEIHLGPGQERHLAHEAWHLVQQAQGRVQPTTQMKGGAPVNSDHGLEHEADVMGAKAAARSRGVDTSRSADRPVAQRTPVPTSRDVPFQLQPASVEEQLRTQATVSNAVSGARMIYDNAGAGGTNLGMLHGALKMAKGAAYASGVGTVAGAGMELADLGMQAYRDAHDMSSEEIDTELNDRRAAFTQDQWDRMQHVRRMFKFAKAANPGHPSVNPDVSDDAMRGGHLVIEDAGAADNLMTQAEAHGQYGGARGGPSKPMYNLPSSHYHGAAQSELQMPSDNQMNFGTGLHGRTGGHTWVQMEAHSGVWSDTGGLARMYKDYALHGTDYARHKATGRQVGPLGTSRVMEANPLRVTAQNLRTMETSAAAAAAARARFARLGIPLP